MKQFNPSYGAKMNNSPTSFTLVVHVPELPIASSEYKDKIYFLKTDSCFYHCVESGNAWKWEKVTFGTRRQFVLPVAWIIAGATGYTFNDEVDTLYRIVYELSKYDAYFDEILTENAWLNSGTNATLNKVIGVANEVISWVNYNCKSNLTSIPAGGADTAQPDGATCQELATYLNALILAVNPHAGFSAEISRIDSELAVLNSHLNSPYSFVVTTDTTPSSSKIYYIKDGSYYRLAGTGENPNGKITSFTAGTTYYEVTGGVTIATPQEFTALSVTVGTLNEEFHTFASDVSAFHATLNSKFTGLVAADNNASSRLTALEASVDDIVNKYLGWNIDDNRKVIARLTAIENSIGSSGSTGTLSGRMNAVEETVDNLVVAKNTAAATLSSIVSTIGSPSSGMVKDVNDAKTSAANSAAAVSAQSAEITALKGKLTSLKGVFQSISTIEFSGSAGFNEVCTAIRSIKELAATAVGILTDNASTNEE